VLSVTPTGTGAAVTGTVFITFSEAMDATPGTVELNGTTLITLDWGWSGDKKVFGIGYIGLTNTTYLVKIFGFKDVAGNTMAVDNSYSFTTMGGIPPNAPAGLYNNSTNELLVPFDKTSATTATSTFNEAITKVKQDEGIYTLLLDGDVSVAGNSIDFASPLTLTIVGQGSNRTISLSSAGKLFNISAPNVNLILDNNITLQGRTGNIDSLVMVSGGTLIMKDGSAIKDNRLPGSMGGGVYVSSIMSNKGNFIMNGGEISGHKITNTDVGGGAIGGGVVVSGGNFTMNGGKIINNICEDTSDDSARIQGGGVFIMAGGTFTMSGGEISGNTALFGGGVFMASGTFTMSSGNISGNTAVGGGGVAMDSGNFTLSGGNITDNTASFVGGGLGGGVYVYSDTSEANITMSGGKISENTSGLAGGGVCLEGRNVKFTMEGGEISGNTAHTELGGGGGGVFMDGFLFTMKGGKISRNIASKGGGVLVDKGGFQMYGNGEISGNTASKGGGVYLAVSASVDVYFRMTDGTIYGSTASTGQPNMATTPNSGAAIYIEPGFEAKYGTVNSSNAFTSTGTFTENYENTVKVANGVLQ